MGKTFMVMKLLKSQTGDRLLIERIMYTKRYSLMLDKKRCVGCQICQIVCPKEAIETVIPSKAASEGKKQPTITIDEKKCVFCGICIAICPFGAFSMNINGDVVVPVFEKESFAKLIREIEVDELKCPVGCKICEESCPFNLIKVVADKQQGKVDVKIEKEHCPCCRVCQIKCPYDAIHVRRIILGSIKIHNEKCPENCHECVGACPVPGVLYVSENNKISINDFCCIYCGACKVACPENNALEIVRNSVRHIPVRSGAWYKALEKMTSSTCIAKEFRRKSMIKAQKSVRKRFS